MVVFQQGAHVGKAECRFHFHLVFRLVRPVPAPLLRLGVLHGGQGVFARQFFYIVHDAVLVYEFLLLKSAGLCLPPEDKTQAGIDHSLLFQHLFKVFLGDVGVGEHIQVQLEAVGGARLAFIGLPDQVVLSFCHVLPPLKMEGVLPAVPAGDHVHIFRGILGGAGAQAVEAQGELVVFPFVVLVFAAGVQLAVDQLPVVAALPLVVIHGHAPPEILHFNGAIGKMGHMDAVSIAFPRLVDGVGEDLKKSVSAALDAVGTKDHPGAFAHPVRPFEGRDAFVAVFFFLLSGHSASCPWPLCRAAGRCPAWRAPPAHILTKRTH